MAGVTDVGAVAGATQQVAEDVQPVINQVVDQSYEVAFKTRVENAEQALAALVAHPSDPRAIAGIESLLDGLCADAGYVRTGGVQRCYSITVSDLGVFLDVLAAKILADEKAAATALAK